MNVTVYRRVPVTADISWEQLGIYLDRTGWKLVQIGDWIDDVLPSFKLTRWQRGGTRITLLSNHGPGDLAALVEQIARIEHRQPVDVLADVAGHAILERGSAINRKATAGARLVEAREAFERTPSRRAAEKEQARVRLAQAEAELETATRALEAAE